MKLIYDTIHDSINIENSDLQFIDNRWMKRLKKNKTTRSFRPRISICITFKI